MFDDGGENLEPVFSERREAVRRDGDLPHLVVRDLVPLHLRDLTRTLDPAVNVHRRGACSEVQKYFRAGLESLGLEVGLAQIKGKSWKSS